MVASTGQLYFGSLTSRFLFIDTHIGNIAHAGTLGNGTKIHAPEVQVQRAGTGMRHSEMNPDDSNADFVH